MSLRTLVDETSSTRCFTFIMLNQLRHRVGEIRPSQLMFSFGVGSNVDLPHLSVMVMGLDDWNLNDLQGNEIVEERLLLAVKAALGEKGSQIKWLFAPPSPPESASRNSFDEGNRVGVPVAPFPRWLRCPRCNLLAPLSSGLFRLEPNPHRPDRSRYCHHNCGGVGRPPTALPARFMVACEGGHLDDFPWQNFVHAGEPCNGNSQLKLVESGISGEASAIFVECTTCGKKQSMGRAFQSDFPDKIAIIDPCNGRHPHLRTHDEGCEYARKAILLGASNAWFPVLLSTFSIPVEGDALAQLVEDNWAILEKTESAQNIELLRSIGQLKSLIEYSNEQIFDKVEAKRQAGEADLETIAIDLKTPEWQVLSQPLPERESPDFKLRVVPAPDGYDKFLENVVLVERLREVHALLGFTRIGAPGDYGDVIEIPPQRCAPLSRQKSAWVPAAQVRGEGIFLRLRETEVVKWCETMQARNESYFKAHKRWREQRNIDEPAKGFPGIRYVLLHSLSHALMRQLCLECGYGASSIRERIYSREPHEENGPMAGILIYTAAPDSEGTLGGLVRLGEPIELGRHLEAAMQGLEMCASDPLCAEHQPSGADASLHGAACHACLFAPETSCERGNKFLDRAVLTKTFGSKIQPFFDL